MSCWRLNPGWLHTKQVTYGLYYLSSPTQLNLEPESHALWHLPGSARPDSCLGLAMWCCCSSVVLGWGKGLNLGPGSYKYSNLFDLFLPLTLLFCWFFYSHCGKGNRGWFCLENDCSDYLSMKNQPYVYYSCLVLIILFAILLCGLQIARPDLAFT